jgi:DNA replication protein DnaC
MTTFNELIDALTYLKLNASIEYIKELHLNNEIDELSIENTYKVLNKQVIAKEENNKLYNVKVAGFPFNKTLDDYDFSFQPSINEQQIRDIAESNFYDDAYNIVYIGSPGVGKTHLAISIGISVATKRNSVYFIKFSKLITILRDAYNENRLEKKLKVYNKYKLLIIDEVGFSEITPLESKLFFQLVDLRYEKKSTIFTSNISFNKWTNILGNDELITRAILDRILHHSYLFNITGNSYRIKDKLKLGNSNNS